jgi:hypothetical protein
MLTVPDGVRHAFAVPNVTRTYDPVLEIVAQPVSWSIGKIHIYPTYGGKLLVRTALVSPIVAVVSISKQQGGWLYTAEAAQEPRQDD